MNIVHTAGQEIGQIYVPFVNWVLAAATLSAVIFFGSSDALAGAFGIAVSLLMAITTLMATFVALHWKHNPILVYGLNGGLLALDLLFFASTSTKLFEGGWFPLLIALVIAFLMLTWRKGEDIMDTVRLEVREPTEKFVELLTRNPPLRVPGVAVVLGRVAKGVPLALSHNIKCNRPVLLSYTNAAPTAIRTPRIMPNKICLAGVSHRSGHLNARTFTKATARSISSCRTLVRDCDKDRTKAAAYSRRCLHLDTHLTIGSIARVRTKIQATITAHVSATAPDGTTTLRKSGTTSTTLRDTATAKSDHSAQFFIADA